MAKVTQAMTEAQTDEQGNVVGVRVDDVATAWSLAGDMAESEDVSAEDVRNSLPMARAMDANDDSAFGVKFCNVSDWRELDFEQAAAYYMGRFPNMSPYQSFTFALAAAAEGMGGMDAERKIIEAFDWFEDAGAENEPKGRDAVVVGENLFGSIKRNDRTKARHGSRKGWGDDKTLLVSWGDNHDGSITVAFEGSDRDVMGYKVVA